MEGKRHLFLGNSHVAMSLLDYITSPEVRRSSGRSLRTVLLVYYDAPSLPFPYFPREV